MNAEVRLLDNVLRIGLLALGGAALALALAWYLRLCWEEWRGGGTVVIAPMTVIDGAGKGNADQGQAMALMLQARLESLNHELNMAQASLTETTGAGSVPVFDTGLIGGVRPDSTAGQVQGLPQMSLLQPVEMKLSVGGVDVGGLLAWLQRQISTRRTLNFTVYQNGQQAQAFGSMSALGLGDASMRLQVDGKDGKPPTLDSVVDRMAHEILRRWLAQDPSNKVQWLQADEFESLARVLVLSAQADQRARRGKPSQQDFARLVPSISQLADVAPDWGELSYFAAWVADKAGDAEKAQVYYGRAKAKLDPVKQAVLLKQALVRIDALELAEAPTATSTHPSAPDGPGQLQAVLDYTADIKRVRDGGNEGSVVGLALATALEYQIAKATQRDVPISARYIYYAARLRSPNLAGDQGAYIKDGIEVLRIEGAVEEAVWPYRPGEFKAKPPAAVETAKRYRIANARQIKGLQDLKRALAQTGPAVIGITMYQSAMQPDVAKTGVIPMPTDRTQPVGGHAVVVVGYDDRKKMLKFVNSWGPGWGEKGFGYLPYDYLRKNLSDGWTFSLAQP